MFSEHLWGHCLTLTGSLWPRPCAFRRLGVKVAIIAKADGSNSFSSKRNPLLAFSALDVNDSHQVLCAISIHCMALLIQFNLT